MAKISEILILAKEGDVYAQELVERMRMDALDIQKEQKQEDSNE